MKPCFLQVAFGYFATDGGKEKGGAALQRCSRNRTQATRADQSDPLIPILCVSIRFFCLSFCYSRPSPEEELMSQRVVGAEHPTNKPVPLLTLSYQPRRQTCSPPALHLNSQRLSLFLVFFSVSERLLLSFSLTLSPFPFLSISVPSSPPPSPLRSLASPFLPSAVCLGANASEAL